MAAKALAMAALLGPGFLWGWMGSFWMTVAPFVGGIGIGIHAGGGWTYYAVASTCVYFALSFAAAKRLRVHGAAQAAVAGIATIVGCCAIAASYVTGFGGAFFEIAGSVLAGVGVAWLYLVWVDLLCFVDTETLEIVVPLNTLVAVLARIPAFIGGLTGVAISAALPVLSLVAYMAANRIWANGIEASGVVSVARGRASANTSVQFVLAAVYAFCAYALMDLGSSCTAFASPEMSGVFGKAGSIVTATVAVFLVFAIARFSPRIDAVTVYMTMAPVLAVSALLYLMRMPWSTGIADAFASVADTTMIVLLIYFVTLARNGAANATVTMGAVLGAGQLGGLVGGATALFANAESWFAGPALVLVAMLLLAPLSILPFLQEGKFFSARPEAGSDAESPLAIDRAGTLGAATEAPQPQAPATAAGSATTSIESTCLALAEKSGLSKRELEILVMLAQGRSRPYIRETLCISTNTIATHARHIYAKLGVHSKQEIINLVRGETA